MPARRATAAGVSALLQYFYPIQEFMREGGSRAQAWGLVADLVEQGGPTTEGSTIFYMNEVWARARNLENARAGFAAAGDLTELDAGMMAPAPWLGSSGLGQTFDAYQIRAALDLEGLELDTPIYMDIKLPGSLEGWSKAELIDFVAAEMQQKLDDYDEDQLAALGIESGLTITGLTDVQIMQL